MSVSIPNMDRASSTNIILRNQVDESLPIDLNLPNSGTGCEIGSFDQTSEIPLLDSMFQNTNVGQIFHFCDQDMHKNELHNMSESILECQAGDFQGNFQIEPSLIQIEPSSMRLAYHESMKWGEGAIDQNKGSHQAKMWWTPLNGPWGGVEDQVDSERIEMNHRPPKEDTRIVQSWPTVTPVEPMQSIQNQVQNGTESLNNHTAAMQTSVSACCSNSMLPLMSPAVNHQGMSLPDLTYQMKLQQLSMQLLSTQPISLPSGVRPKISIASPEPFPHKLYRMLQEIESRGLTNIVSFTPSGKSFRIVDRQSFLSQVSPLYFSHKNVQSFKRQLSHYNFKLIHTGKEAGAYTHKFFQKGRPELLDLVHRRKRAADTT